MQCRSLGQVGVEVKIIGIWGGHHCWYLRESGKTDLGGKILLVLELRVRLKLLERRGNSRLEEICKQKEEPESFSLG